MKKLGIALLLFSLVLTALFAALQSGPAKRWVAGQLTARLHEVGLDLELGSVRGLLPQKIEFRDVTISAIDTSESKLKISSLQFNLSVWHLFRKELHLKAIQTTGAFLKTSSEAYPFAIGGSLKTDGKEGSFKIALNTDLGRWQIASHFEFTSDRRFTFSPIVIRGGSSKNDWANGSLKGTFEGDKLLGEVAFSGNFKEVPWKLATSLDWSKGNSLILPDLKVDTAQVKTTSQLELTPGLIILGQSNLSAETLNTPFYPQLFGELQGTVSWSETDGKQGIELNAGLKNLFHNALAIESGTIRSELTYPLLSGSLSVELSKIIWENTKIDRLEFATTVEGDEAPFFALVRGSWKKPFDIRATGTWSKEPHLALHLESLKGDFFFRPLHLDQPVTFHYLDSELIIPQTELSLSNAAFQLELHRKKSGTKARFQARDLPLEFLALSEYELPIVGTMNLLVNLDEKNNSLQGNLEADISQFEGGKGTLRGNLDGRRLSLVAKAPSTEFSLSLPIELSLSPFHLKLLTEEKVEGNLISRGNIEDFLDFVDLGPHRFEGTYTSELKLSHTLASPYLEGFFRLSKGSYENYYTGMELQNIEAEVKADKDRILLTSLHASDGAQSENFRLSGKVALNPKEHFPFHLEAAFSDLKASQIDLVDMTLNGNLTIEGNRESALAQGEIAVTKGDLTIPDHIPRALPDLQVTYRNQSQPIVPTLPSYTPYPLYLNVHLIAPGTIHINGRGLTSKWKGDFQLTGTTTNPAAKGKLELETGEFLFSSISFKLTEGMISMSGYEQEMPYLNLAGTMETKGISITARFKGPLDNPQLTFQSNPPLSIGSIISYLLFGQDVSEISGFQALQLATSIAKFAGEGSDVMESTRRSLGVDRLRIVSDPSGDGDETIALQVGKYITDGVLVTFTQGADDSGPNISVEVELKNNFVFQVESLQEQEQGKFTLKWSKNY
jgi:translocation and assembly module TamB